MEVTVSPDPVNCVALGTAMSLRMGDKLETGFTDATPAWPPLRACSQSGEEEHDFCS